MGLLFIFPIAAYLFAGVIWLVLRLAGREAPGLDIRFALFWSFLAAAPLWLLNGFLTGFLDPSPAIDVIAIGCLVLYFVLLLGGMRAAAGMGKAS